eukprot:768033-Rhodomonas_salina.1
MCHMNGKVKGLPSSIRNTCVTPQATVQWDMLDMGADYETLQGNRYATLFVVKRTRFLMAFLHSSKDGHVITDMMCKALAKVGSWPTHIQSNGAAEYNSP